MGTLVGMKINENGRNFDCTLEKVFICARSSERSCERKWKKKSSFFRKTFFASSEKLTFEKENAIF